MITKADLERYKEMRKKMTKMMYDISQALGEISIRVISISQIYESEIEILEKKVEELEMKRVEENNKIEVELL